MNTKYFLDCVAGNVFKTKDDPALPTEYYIGLSTSTPNAEGNNVSEPSGDAGYARVKLTDMSEPSNGVVTNNSAINFNESSQSWGTVTYFVIYDAASGGHLLMYGELTTPRSVETATIMTIKQNYLNLSVKNPA